MKWFRKLELKRGQKAIQNLMIVLCVLFAAGWVIQLTAPEIYYDFLSLSMPKILHGEIWRLVTWLMYPPSTSLIWGLIMVYVYWTIGRNIEMVWGSFEFDWFIIQGVIFHILGALVIYLIYGVASALILLTPINFCLSIMLAFMMAFPDAQFLLFFVVPIKGKYLGVFYVIMTVLNFIQGGIGTRAEIIISVINVAVFFIISGKTVNLTSKFRKR